jgi:hypothetical protein
MKYKLEIIDNQIQGFYEYTLFSWKKKNWWSKEEWNYEYQQVIGYNYICPEIYQGKITIKEYFEREIKIVLKQKTVSEIHKTTITNYDK